MTLIDSFGRVHDNLRISVTDRCNLRCTYCMPEDVTFLDRGELLTFEEIAKFVRVAAPLGVNKLRLTGGEPLMRKDLHKLVRLLVPIPGITDIGLTTNGILLKAQAAALREAGLTRLNVSLDTLDAGRFRELSRRDGLDAVLAGLEEAKALGFAIKLNAVAIRGFIEHDAVPLANYCRENGFELRFIEYMPIGAEAWEREKCFLAHELLELLEREVSPLAPSPEYDPRAPAMEFDYADGRGRVGIIASVSRPFCKSCNRIRLTADGKVRNCLFAHDEADVKTLLRSEDTDAAIAETIRRNVAAKWEGHEINSAKFVKPLRTMHAIGG
ncbi:MAG: GTP 3',8-cyclase MoaA [Planctomycetia bacterium]|nr:GTP 3',8-cyclase MoaA [Planctomycetia bacterium]